MHMCQNVDFTCNSNINVKWHLSRIHIWMNTDILLYNFNSVWLHSKFILFAGSSSLSSNNATPPFRVSNGILKICKQGVDNASNGIIGHLNINSVRKRNVLIETIIKVITHFPLINSVLQNLNNIDKSI